MSKGFLSTTLKLPATLTVAALFALGTGSVAAATDLFHERESNDTLAEAERISLPAPGSGLRILGDIDDTDQDAYRFNIDEDAAGRRWNLRISGTAGARTEIDVFDVGALLEADGTIPPELEKRPQRVWTLSDRDGSRPAQADALLLAPGTYVLGVSRAGAPGAYRIDLTEHDQPALSVFDADAEPAALSLRRPQSVWIESAAVFDFALDDDAARSRWELSLQASAGREARARLLAGDGTILLNMTGSGGLPTVRRDLELASGRYRLEVDVAEPDTVVLGMQAGAAAVADGREVEPNDEQPNTIALGAALEGTFEDRDQDNFRFTVTEGASQQLLDMTLSLSPASAEARVCLVRESIELQYCRRSAQEVTLPRLGLAAGDYRLELTSRGATPARWQLSWAEVGSLRPGEEAEPNDTPAQAIALAARGFGRGRFDTERERDYWQFQVTGEAQLWRLQLQGDGLHELALERPGGEVVARSRADGQGRLRLDNLYLTPGEYYAMAQGTDADYVLRLLDLGPPPPGMELEPNDDLSRATRLQAGLTHSGTLAAGDDVDLYRFNLPGRERIGLTVRPPVDGGIRGRLRAGDDAAVISDIRNGREPGRELAWDLHLPPGDYSLELTPGQVSDAEYAVVLERLPWFAGPADREPNDVRDHASPLPPDGRLIGRVGATAAGEDWYRLPALDRPANVELPVHSGLRLELVAAGLPQQNLLERHGDVERGSLQPGRGHWLRIRGNGEYRYDLSALVDTPAQAEVAPLEVAMQLSSDRIQAFSRWEQRVQGTIRIINDGSAVRQARVDTHVSDARWTVTGLPGQVDVPPGASIELPFEVTVPPDAVARWPAQLAVRVRDAGGDSHVQHTIAADVAAPAVDARFHWPVPAPLRGGLNAARSAYGAAPVSSPNIDDDDLEDMESLFDGLVEIGPWAGFSLPTQRRNREQFGQPTVRLAGQDPVPVRGFVIDPTAALTPTESLERFAIELSLDGERFTEVLRGRLQPIAQEQFFVLDAAVPARWARLVPLTAPLGQADKGRALRLGEFKVIAEPGWQPFEAPVNLADPSLGGHLVWAEPWLRGSAFDTSLLQAGEAPPAPRLSGDDTVQLVLGFHEARAARIDGLNISFPEAPQTLPTTVTVDAALHGPTGPWQTLGRFELDALRAGMSFDEPAWARYLRLRFAPPANTDRLQWPDRIAVLEAAAGHGYLSILGEWGRDRPYGPLEMHDEPLPAGAGPQAGNTTRETAMLLEEAEPVFGQASLGKVSAWYRLDIPDERNSVELEAWGFPMLEVAPRLFDAGGGTVRLVAEAQSPERRRWRAFVEPGASYFLQMVEPPLSVIFSWDTSGSVGAYFPFVVSALNDYAAGVEPGRDEVNLVPFGSTSPLLERWLGDAYPLAKLLAAYPHDASSSAAEQALAVSARSLQTRPGKRAVVLLTDAATSTDEDLWPALQAARPQVFALRLSSQGSGGASARGRRHLMQDWARVNGGHYDYVTGMDALSRGFDRAVAQLRRPVQFALSAQFDRVEEPSPASIAVIAGDGPVAAGAAVEIILDASGSMLQRLDGTRRIDIARAAVIQAIEEALPAGIPLALRVYGHLQAGACRTDLEIPLQPLDKARMLERVQSIQAINLARTPIAESLAAVASDLADVEGRRLVVLLTDGEETCDGDPAAEIERLEERGLDVRLNVVGFAVDDEPMRRQFRQWAREGDGHYLDAGDADGLQAALVEALRTPFTVIDDSGQTVAGGLVGGDPVELPAGRYDIRVESATPRLLSDIELRPGDRREVPVL